MKKKLDLNNLLAKYEGISTATHAANYYSPTNDYEYQQTPIEHEFYQSTTPVYQPRPETTSTQPITGNFQMSKSECQAFLVRVREELRLEERGMINFADNSMKHIQDRFRANHEKIKREILELLEKSFRENQKYIIEELRRHNTAEPQEFIPVHRKIAEIDEDINRLLYGLKGTDYRKSIAETVVKDYSYELTSLKDNVKVAKDNYLSSLGEVQPDRARIDCIREDLQKLFRLSKKTSALVQESLFAALGSKFKSNNEQAPRAATSYTPPPPQNGGQSKQRQRKSFFNFGFNE